MLKILLLHDVFKEINKSIQSFETIKTFKINLKNDTEYIKYILIKKQFHLTSRILYMM